MASVPAFKKMGNALQDIRAGRIAADRRGLMRQATRLIVAEAAEAEAAEAPARGCEHGTERRGYRNGHGPGTVESAEGEIEFAVPQPADMAARRSGSRSPADPRR